MKLLRVMTEVFGKPWLIKPEVHKQISDIVTSHANGTVNHASIEELFPKMDKVQPEIIDETIAVIPIEGVIGKRVGMLEKSSGVTDVDDISAMVEWAADDPAIEQIVLKIRSPGGTVTGVPELAELIGYVNAQKKPVTSFTDEMACSAAFWIGSQSYAFYASPSAEVGSVGVYMYLLDQSRMYEAAGIKPEVFKAGTLKGIGLPGVPLTDEQRQHLQGHVDRLYGQFTSAVRKGRGQIADEHLQGQSLFAGEAKAAGMIDEVATFAELISDMKKMKGRK